MKRLGLDCLLLCFGACDAVDTSLMWSCSAGPGALGAGPAGSGRVGSEGVELESSHRHHTCMLLPVVSILISYSESIFTYSTCMIRSVSQSVKHVMYVRVHVYVRTTNRLTKRPLHALVTCSLAIVHLLDCIEESEIRTNSNI